MNVITSHLLRRILAYSGAERYIEGISAAKFNAVRSDGWIPKELEITGPLHIKPPRLVDKASIDKPAVLELKEGGSIDRIVVKLPAWVRTALVQCVRSPFSSKAAEAATISNASSNGTQAASDAKGKTGFDDSLFAFEHIAAELPPQQPRALPNRRVHDVLRPVVPPPPLYLPGKPCREKAAEAAVDDDKDEKVRIGLHGLKLCLRAFTAEELSDMRGEIAREALQTLLLKLGNAVEAVPEKEASVPHPSCGSVGAPCEGIAQSNCSIGCDRPEFCRCETNGFRDISFNTLMQQIHENLCIECFDVDATYDVGENGWKAHLKADRVDFVALFRPPGDRDEECWFGEPVILTEDQGILEMRLRDGELRVGQMGAAGFVPEEVATLTCRALTIIALVTIPEGIPVDESKRPPPAPPGEPPCIGIRVAAMNGTKLSLPGGAESITPILGMVAAFMAGSIACDPNTLSSLPVPPLKDQLDRTEFATLWWRDFYERQRPDDLTQERGPLICAMNCSSSVPPCGFGNKASSQAQAGLSEEERSRLKTFLKELPLAVQAALLRFGDTAAHLVALPMEYNFNRLQSALCLALADIFPCTSIKFALEFGRKLVIELDCPNYDDLPDHECDRVPSDDYRGASSEPPAQREKSRTRNTENAQMELHLVGLAYYMDAYQIPGCWKKFNRILIDGLGVRHTASGRSLLLCNMEETQLKCQHGVCGASAFRAMATDPTISIIAMSGCFSPGGTAGPCPWALECGLHQSARARLRSRSTINISDFTTGSTISDLRERSISMAANLLGPYLDQPQQPPRLIFIDAVFESAICVTLWPCMLSVLMELVPNFSQAEFEFNADFLDVNFPPGSAIPVHVAFKSVQLQFIEDADTDVCFSLGLDPDHVADCFADHGFNAQLDPLSLDELQNFRLELCIRGISARCRTLVRDTRPVLAPVEYFGLSFCSEDCSPDYSSYGCASPDGTGMSPGGTGMGFGTSATTRTDVVTHYQSRMTTEVAHRTTLKIDLRSPKIKLDISPQLGVVVTTLLAETMDVMAAGSGRTSDRSSEPTPPSPTIQNFSRLSETTGAEEGDKDYRFEFTMDPLTINFCDAISALLRVSFSAQAEAALKARGALEVVKVEANIRVPHITGEFASQKEGIWEPFLEPWCLGADCSYTHETGVEILISNGTQLFGNENEFTPLFPALTGRLSTVTSRPMCLNMTTQLTRSCLCLSNQFDQFLREAATTASSRSSYYSNSGSLQNNAKTPLFLEDRLRALSVKSNTTGVQSGRINALNMSGFEVEAWFHLGRGLKTARHNAMETHWMADSKMEDPHVVLPGVNANSVAAPCALDRYIIVPANTVLALYMRSRDRMGKKGSCPLFNACTTVRTVRTETTVGQTYTSGSNAVIEASKMPIGGGQSATMSAVPISAASSTVVKSNPVTIRTLAFADQCSRSRGDSNMTDSTVDKSENLDTAKMPEHVPTKTTLHTGNDVAMESGTLANDHAESHPMNEMTSRAWPRKDTLPILPLSAGWCVVIKPGVGLESLEKQQTKLFTSEERGSSQNTPVENQFLTGWHRDEMIVQVLVPKPAHRLVLIGSPFRVFNYTDTQLYLAFVTIGLDRAPHPVEFPQGLFGHATAPARLLGSEQPYDAQWLGLPPSPLEQDEWRKNFNKGISPTDSGHLPNCLGNERFVWPLPSNSFCCVPTPESFRKGACEFNFTVSSRNQGLKYSGAWSAQVCPGAMKPQEWFFLESLGEFYRIACFVNMVEKPYPVEVISFVILPAYSVINLTPGVLDVDVRPDDSTVSTFRCPVICGFKKASPLDDIYVSGNEDTVQLEPGKCSHFYDINSSEAVMMKFRLVAIDVDSDNEDDQPSQQKDCKQDSHWSEVLYDVCSSCREQEKRTELTFEPPYAAVAMEVSCVDYIIAVSCPMWLLNATAMDLYAGRHRKVFPVVRGVTLLGGHPSDVKLYLLLDDTKLSTRSRPRSPSVLLASGKRLFKRHLPAAGGNHGPDTSKHEAKVCSASASEGDESVPFDTILTPGASSYGNDATESPLDRAHVLKCNFNVPLTSASAECRFQSDDCTYTMTVIREAFPALFGELSAPTTCFHVVPAVMISNCTKLDLHVRQVGKHNATSGLLRIPGGDSVPFWGKTFPKGKRHLQIQLVPVGEDADQDAWSTHIVCESLANGRHALAMPVRTAEADTEGNNSTSSATQVLSVEISDALEGVLSLSVSQQPCLVVGCWCQSISSIGVETDSPPTCIMPVESVGGGGNGTKSIRDDGAARGSQPKAHPWIDMKHATTVTAHAVADAAHTAQHAAVHAANFAVDKFSKVTNLASTGAGYMKEGAHVMFGKARTDVSSCSRKRRSKRMSSHGPVNPEYQFKGRVGWPVQVGWYQPFKVATETDQPVSLVLIITWSQYADANGQWVLNQVENDFEGGVVRVNFSLGRVTPIVILRVHRDKRGVEFQVAVMVRIRRKSKKLLEEHVRELRLTARRRRQRKATTSLSLNGQFADQAAKSLEQAWLKISHGSPELIEMREISVDNIGDIEVEWACGECGELCPDRTTRRHPVIPQFCDHCHAILCPDNRASQSDLVETESAVARSASSVSSLSGDGSPCRVISIQKSLSSEAQRMAAERELQLQAASRRAAAPPSSYEIMFGSKFKLELQVSKIRVSVISERERAELFLGDITGIKMELERKRGHEFATVQLEGIRFDCQPRIEQRRAFERRRRKTCGRLRQKLQVNAAVQEKRRHLSETPSVIANVGARNADKALSNFDLPCIQITWERPVMQGEGTSLCMKKFRLEMIDRWEIVIDDIAALAAIRLHSEISSAIVECNGKPGGREASEMFDALLGSTHFDFEANFIPIPALPVVQVEDLQISEIEVGLWGCIVLSTLPTSAMPASLAFLLKVLALSDTLYVEGSTCKLKDIDFKPLRGSQFQIQAGFRSKYQGDFLYFLASSFGASNLLRFLSLTAPFSIMSAAFRDLKDVALAIDLSPLTLDSEYIEERKENAASLEAVASLEEGIFLAAGCLRDGVIGMADVVKKPQEMYRKKGIIGIPQGLARGLMSFVFKPLDALYQSVVALAKGLCACKLRRTPSVDLPSPSRSRGSVGSPAASLSSISNSDRSNDRSPRATARSLWATQNTMASWRGNSKPKQPAKQETPATIDNKKKPLLHGEECIRLPRLLFGEGGAVVPFQQWHGELVAKLGAYAHGICNAWCIAGSVHKAVHIIICVTHTHLLLVDLNRTPNRNAKARGFKGRGKPSGKSLETAHMIEMLEASVETLRKQQRQQWKCKRANAQQAAVHQSYTYGGVYTGAITGDSSKRAIGTASPRSWNSRKSFKVTASRTIMKKVIEVSELSKQRMMRERRRCRCCHRKQNSNSALIDEKVQQKVLGSWAWSELTCCEISDVGIKRARGRFSTDMRTLSSWRSSSRERMSPKSSVKTDVSVKRQITWERPIMADTRSAPMELSPTEQTDSHQPVWMLTVHTAYDESSEWPLPCLELPSDELQKICRGVNQAIREFKA